MPIDYKEYPSNWKTEIRPAVLARANNCCEECGIENHTIIKRTRQGYRKPSAQEWDMIKSRIKPGGHNMTSSLKFHGFTKIILTIAHLDHDKMNPDVPLDRLKALCQKCHLHYDIEHHKANRKYGRNHRQANYKIPFE